MTTEVNNTRDISIEDEKELSFEDARDFILDNMESKYKNFDWEENSYRPISYNIYNYRHNDNLRLDIFTDIFKKKISVFINIFTETLITKTYYFNQDNMLDIFCEYIEFVYNLKKNYTYSKILDTLILNDKFLNEEKKIISLTFIKHDIIDDCCVCMDKNTVLTKCGHNLCRVCHSKILFEGNIRKKQHELSCPMCRECICIDCIHDYNEDN
jgi:hypothetical protein